jgi:RimJ/RimL family protein N-acetyltransferase
MPPLIETERLLLRGHRRDDLPECAKMWADDAVTRHITGKPSSRQQTWARILGYVGHWILMGYGYWAIEEKKSRAYIGELGFADFKREIDPAIQGAPEMGWALKPSAHGRGYAKEAIQAALAWADANLKFERTICIINSNNPRSIALAEKFGFRCFQDARHMDVPVKLFSRSRVLPRDVRPS